MTADPKDPFRLDRTALAAGTVADQAPEDWLKQPVHKRFEALEYLRRILFGNASATARLQRVFEATQRT